MSSIIKIKRSATEGSVPSSLGVGELAVNLFDRKLYVGNTTGVTAVGGEIFSITSQDATAGAGAYLKVNGETSSNTVLLNPGEGIDIARQANGSILISGEDATTTNKGIASFDTNDFGVSSGAVSLNDAVVKTVASDSGSATPSTHGFTIAGTDAQGIDTSATGSTVTITAKDATDAQKGVASFDSGDFTVTSGAVTIATGGVGNAQLENDGITLSANTGTPSEVQLGDTLNVVSGDATGITVDYTSDTVTISGVDATSAIKGVAKFDSGDFSVTSGEVTLADSATGAVIAINGTTNEVEVSRNNGTVTVGLPDNVTIGGTLDVTGVTNFNDTTTSTSTTTGAVIVDGGIGIAENANIGGDLRVTGDTTIDGNLTVEGALTYISTSTVYADDGMFKLAANNAGDTVDTGIYGAVYHTGNTSYTYSGYFRDANDSGIFKFYTGLDVEPTQQVDTTDSGYTLAQVDAIIDGGTY